MGKDKQVGSGRGVISHQLQGVGKAGFLLKYDLQLRDRLGQIVGEGLNNSLLLIMPDHQLAGIFGGAALSAAGGQSQKQNQGQEKRSKSFHANTSYGE